MKFQNPSALFITLFLIIWSACATNYNVSVSGSKILLNNTEIKVIGLRCSNALVSDSTAQMLITYLDTFKNYGVNLVTVYFMGSRFGDVGGYLKDQSLNPTVAARMGEIIEAADNRGMMVLIGCLYWGTSTAKDSFPNPTTADQTSANKAVANVVQWLKYHSYRNFIIDPDNENMTGLSVELMVQAGHAVDNAAVIACNGSAGAPTANLNIHFGPKTAGKPYFDSEYSPDFGNYWSGYSKQANYYNYIRIGRYTSAYKTLSLNDTKTQMAGNNGIGFASTWLQCGPLQGIGGPFMTPGGMSNFTDSQVNANVTAVLPDAGVRWWLEYIKTNYGAWVPPAPTSVVSHVLPSRVTITGYDNLKVFDLSGKLLARATHGDAAALEKSLSLRQGIPYLVVYGKCNIITNVQKICRP
ncbi:MAG TPA: hypothetical protein VLX68_09410 [Chitinivibrionales bacterium]|nr:hypothetical protein [Chitinivibrionales bacterium]